jgi:hypothetical protein
LLVAPAALGLMSPLVANATEVNLNDISNYSDVDSIEFANSFSDDSSTDSTLLAGGEGLVDSHSHDSSFSETTTASFSADFLIGAEKGSDDSEAVTAGYSYGIGLTTSFTGEDSFNVTIDAGNAADGNLDELDGNGSGDGLIVDGINYTFPLGDKITAFVGDSEDGSMLYTTACAYSGVTNTLDDCAANFGPIGAGGGTAAGASFDIGNGFTAALGYTGDGTDDGLMTSEGNDAYGVNFAYTGDSYGASVMYASVEDAEDPDADSTFWTLNAYWTPSETGAVPSVSVGYEMGDPEEGGDTTQWFAGFQWDEMGPGTLGAAVGSNGPTVEDADEFAMYEVYYAYPVNDSNDENKKTKQKERRK